MFVLVLQISFSSMDIDVRIEQAVFQTLCHLRLTDHPSLPGRGLIITVRDEMSILSLGLIYI